jgi:hypothetical protein
MQQSREGGRLQHVSRGLYRLRFFPGSPFEHIAAAWVVAGPDLAVISHESALELYRLADVAPSDVHITLRYAGIFVGFAVYWACMFIVERPRLVPAGESPLVRL